MGQAIQTAHSALIIEGDRALRDLTAALLEETDLRVVETDSEEEALSYLDAHADAVMLVFAGVCRSSPFDGVDLVQAVTSRWPWIKLVVTSGDLGDRPEHLPAAATYLPKPWRALDLLIAAERAAADHGAQLHA